MTRSSFASVLALLVLVPAATVQAQGEKQRAEGVMESFGYAQAIAVGNTIYLSGAVARGATMEEQVAGAYASLSRTLARYGATLADVVKETVYTTDMPALSTANTARRAAYGTHSPAATWVQINRLLMEQAKVEIEVIAVIGSAVAKPAK